MQSRKIIAKIILLAVFTLIFFGIAFLMVEAYDPTEKYFVECFHDEDCDDPSCPKSLKCWDDVPGCIVSCQKIEDKCPLDSACYLYSGIQIERCGYVPDSLSCNIAADPISGSPTTLTWSSDANSNCEASGGWSGIKPASGTEVVYPSGSTIYTLTCTNNCMDGSFSKSCSITVNLRHENCCDNWGWDNVRRCGGCCGVAANCVG